MITRLQTFFLKHNKWLFGGLLVVIIVTFVLTIGPQSFFDGSGPQQRRSLKYFGYDLTSEADQRAMAFTAEVSAILHPELRLNREQLMDYAYLRVAALGIADRLGIPDPDRDDLAAYVETLMIFQDPQTGRFSPQTYQTVMDALQSNARFEPSAIARVMREDYRIRQVRAALGGPDYSLPFETRMDFTDFQTVHTLALAHLDYASFEPEIDLSGEALMGFFRENPARYEIAETLSVSALLFKAEAFLHEVADPADPESIEDLAAWRVDQARRIAARKGEQFSVRLWRDSVALGSPQYAALLAEFSAQVVDLPPYRRDQPPVDSGMPTEVLNSMWIYASNPTRYFSDIAQIPDGAVVLVKRGLTEARMPVFEEVLDAVAADFSVAEKRRLFAEKGQALYRAIQERLGEESFATIAESLGLELETFPAFSGSEVPSEIRRSNVWEQAQYLDAGAVSRMVLQADRGTFAHIAAKEVPEVDLESPEFKEFAMMRTGALSESLGWARLREITDQSLSVLLGRGTFE